MRGIIGAPSTTSVATGYRIAYMYVTHIKSSLSLYSFVFSVPRAPYRPLIQFCLRRWRKALASTHSGEIPTVIINALGTHLSLSMRLSGAPGNKRIYLEEVPTPSQACESDIDRGIDCGGHRCCRLKVSCDPTTPTAEEGSAHPFPKPEKVRREWAQTSG